MIPPDDRGFTLGDGLFETLLAEAGELRDVDAHLRRMTAGATMLGLPAPDAGAAKAAMQRAIADAGLTGTRAAVRLSLTAGSGGRGLDRPGTPRPRLVATAAPAPVLAGPARVMISSIRRNDGSPAARLKTLAYLDNVLARREALAQGADEALMLNTRGELACAAAANLFWTADGRLFTPDLSCGVLPGIVRAKVIAAARADGIDVQEVRGGPEVVEAADGIFLTNSLIGVRAVCSIGGRSFATGRLARKMATVAELL